MMPPLAGWLVTWAQQAARDFLIKQLEHKHKKGGQSRNVPQTPEEMYACCEVQIIFKWAGLQDTKIIVLTCLSDLRTKTSSLDSFVFCCMCVWLVRRDWLRDLRRIKTSPWCHLIRTKLFSCRTQILIKVPLPLNTQHGFTISGDGCSWHYNQWVFTMKRQTRAPWSTFLDSTLTILYCLKWDFTRLMKRALSCSR